MISAVKYKNCSICKEDKTAKEFGYRTYLKKKSGKRYTYLHSACKPCKAIYMERYNVIHHLKHPAYRKVRYLKYQYGITEEYYELLYREQAGICAICQGVPTIKKDKKFGLRGLHVDHDHKTGKVRGLLCPKCNYYLHRIEDAELFKASIRYLKKHGIEFDFNEFCDATIKSN